MVTLVRQLADSLRIELSRRPAYVIREAPAPDPVTGDYVITVEDRDGGYLGRVLIALRWLHGSTPQTGRVQVRLVDPFGLFSPTAWRRHPPPLEEIAATVDEWLVAMRAQRLHRRKIEEAEGAVHRTLAAVSQRLGPTSLHTQRKGPLRLECRLTLRPKSLADAAATLDCLTEDERRRARVAIWINLDHLTPDRVAALVAAADTYLKPSPHDPTTPAVHRSRRRAPRSPART